ncbi:type II toxin-antitoxin system RelE/ParE family toxin [Algoriphagus aquimarinus]|uniref:type II toxin-antitoxin system RelE/ParE family toxin n=1 Tax=Algoriphagus aquimarinus TaxID=237018 RepID=UPI0030D88AFF|tara:strand:- start:2404 stop:2637 length:234 start_codon:yes stop_codon:yes gene_type:complete
MVKVKWTKQAIENIYSIQEYYLPLSPKFAYKVTDQIFSKERLLASFPTVGRVVPELNNESEGNYLQAIQDYLCGFRQ